MTQIGEMVNVALIIDTNAEIKCPFNDTPPKEPITLETESPADDDVNAAQANNGQVLGKNMARAGRAGWGKSGTWNEMTPPPERIKPRLKLESNGNPDLQVTLADFAKPGATRAYDWKAAAHHLIPGEAALAKSDVYKRFMVEDAKIEAGGKQFTLNAHIGYNVNGNHNGAWLPGNYAIRRAKYGKTWSDLDDEWRFRYAQAVVTRSRKQFHDTHVHYSDNVMNALNALSTLLMNHVAVCEQCKAKSDGKIAPPYRLKAALYRMSRVLGMRVRGWPGTWREPFITSDHYKDMLRQFSQATRDAL
ncbi:MAG: AHH domain-containing protein [Gemmatimonadaceae bacterium]|jgi:hypothetical protein|nr:AHH domain-containing protein [Gemmatimonadaceae bacterium]